MRSLYMFQGSIVIHKVCTNDLMHICVQKMKSVFERSKISILRCLSRSKSAFFRFHEQKSIRNIVTGINVFTYTQICIQ